MPEISIVILSYNTKELTLGCLKSIQKYPFNSEFEIIIIDNASTDGSGEFFENLVNKNLLKIKNCKLKIIRNSHNLGFAKGNNVAKKVAKGKFVLFLNSDTKVESGVLDETIKLFDKDKKLGAVTCKVILPNGKLDKDTRRSFPTPWVAISHFSKLDRLFPKSEFFAKYWYGYLDEDMPHEIDCLQGAFCLVKKSILDDINWFDEDYFLDGEDIDLCWKIKAKGWKILYYPKVKTIHYKGASKGKNSKLRKPKVKERLKFVMAGMNSMEIFYKKRLSKNYSFITNTIVITGIKIMKIIRFMQLVAASI